MSRELAIAACVISAALLLAGYLFALYRKERVRSSEAIEATERVKDAWVRDRRKLQDVAKQTEERRVQMTKDIAEIHRIATNKVASTPTDPAVAISEARRSLEDADAFVNMLIIDELDGDQN